MAAEGWIKCQMKFSVNKYKRMQEEKPLFFTCIGDRVELATIIPEQDPACHSD